MGEEVPMISGGDVGEEAKVYSLHRRCVVQFDVGFEIYGTDACFWGGDWTH